jgi:nucleoside-diphosphate-sugar epimerase
MSTTTYKNVLLVGGAGDLGKHILSALLADSTFNVTVLTRIDSSSVFPSNVTVIKVNYTDYNAVKKALTGQDVVISAVGATGISDKLDHVLIEASVEAGVKWFIPSEFTGDITHPKFSSLPFLVSKVETIQLLKKYESRLSHTFITTGGFLDWGFDNGFLGYDIPHHTVTFYDEGKNLVSATTLPSIGKAVVAIIHHPELTLNKRIYIADATFTQQEALALFEKYSGTKWTVKHKSTKESYKQGDECYAKGDIANGIPAYIMAAIYSEQGASNFEGKTSNNALGLKTIPLEQIVKEAVERSQTRVAH